MMKATMAGLLLLAASATTASAAPYSYIFANSSGSPYCDGVTLSNVGGGVLQGKHTSPSGSCTEGSYAGGLVSRVKGYPGGVFEITTLEPSAPNYEVVFVIDPSAMTFSAYVEDTVDKIKFYQSNTGTLLAGSMARLTKAGAKPAAFGK